MLVTLGTYKFERLLLTLIIFLQGRLNLQSNSGSSISSSCAEIRNILQEISPIKQLLGTHRFNNYSNLIEIKLPQARPIRNATQIWVVTLHQYGISAPVPLLSFRGETRGVVAKCRLFFVINLISAKDHKLLNVINTSRWNKASLQEPDNSLL